MPIPLPPLSFIKGGVIKGERMHSQKYMIKKKLGLEYRDVYIEKSKI